MLDTVLSTLHAYPKTTTTTPIHTHTHTHVPLQTLGLAVGASIPVMQDPEPPAHTTQASQKVHFNTGLGSGTQFKAHLTGKQGLQLLHTASPSTPYPPPTKAVLSFSMALTAPWVILYFSYLPHLLPASPTSPEGTFFCLGLQQLEQGLWARRGCLMIIFKWEQ